MKTGVVSSSLCGLSLALLFMSVSCGKIINDSECGRNELRCDNGYCVANILACDGTVHCPDGSDETTERCKSIYCPKRNFRCQYGACINSYKRCNGKLDCADNSDEFDCSEIIKNDASKCGASEFRCKDGECISATLVCDGMAQCEDQSDETSDVCRDIVCNQFSAACDYGACIPKSKECDGLRDCIDWSDESQSRCPNTTLITDDKLSPNVPSATLQPEEEGCRTKIPNGELRVGCVGSNCLQPSILPNGEAAQLYCDPGFVKSADESFLYCLNNTWLPDVKCQQSCHGLSSDTVILKCKYKGETQDCAKNLPVGTSLNINCKPLYEPVDFATANFINSVCTTSGWDPSPYQCKAICGERKRGIDWIPWHATIYQLEEGKYIPRCTGTIVHPKFIITAAHCIGENLTLRVSVGNVMLDYNGNSRNQQKFDIVNVMIPDKFKDATKDGSGEYDLALLKLNTTMELDDYVRPICLPPSPSVMFPNTVYMPGWSNEKLTGFKLKTMNTTTCIKSVNPFNKKFITIDKYCTSHENNQVGKPSLSAYLGAGQFHRTGKRTGYMLFGIASIVAMDKNIFSTSTNILVHLGWIKPKLKYD